jgi:starch synthase
MRISMLTTGRFWLVDLGRELAARGHEVRVYSLVPPYVTRRFGLPAHCNRWLGPHCAPFYVASRLARSGKLQARTQEALNWAVDVAAARLLEPCDVLVAMSGISLRALRVAKDKYGALVFVERGSRHALSQREIMQDLARRRGEPAPHFDVDRELSGYEIADVVTVPAQHVADSFLERGFPEHRLFVNPFGVAIEIFQPTLAPDGTQPTILMTGAWSLRKGCDVLVEAWRSLPGVRLMHVGPVGDAPLPSDPGFVHIDAVPLQELPRYYAEADVFALASREEGLALVQVQALAAGLPIVCTSRTGGADLKRWASPESIRVVPHDDAQALGAALREALALRPAPGTLRDLLGDRRDQVSWRAYAQRYEQRILQQFEARARS